jgi:hypothetical protein
LTGCPNSTESGCRCPDHAPGLAAFAADPVAYEAALEPLRRPVRLHVVTGFSGDPACNGSMTCPCPRCGRERASRAAQGAGNASPFKVRRAARERRAAA